VALVTLTTDFGTVDGYAGAMKGVIARIAPEARVLDLTHDVPPQDVRSAAFALHRAVPYYPPGTVHCAVVDPGVGTARRALALRVDGEQFLVGPDSGVFTLFLEPFALAEPEAVELTEREWWRAPGEPSATFHGRDVFAPVAAHLARMAEEGAVDLTRFGARADGLARFEMPEPVEDHSAWRGEVMSVDHFGNATTNLPARGIALAGDRAIVEVGDRRIPIVRTYGDVPMGELCAVVGSSGWLELAARDGSAAERLGLAPGIPVVVRRQP
jgi:S-adenosyl-L-methionine hydrolase (adenosine-forming)